MAALTWFSLAFFVVVVLSSAALVVGRGRGAWRALRSFSASAGAAADDAAARASAVERRASELAESTERLEAARARLRRSTAELTVLREAAAETEGLFASLRRTVPRK
jgi:hypothetical protein